jgi:hypothetical protein
VPQLLQEVNILIASTTAAYCDNVSVTYMTANHVHHIAGSILRLTFTLSTKRRLRTCSCLAHPIVLLVIMTKQLHVHLFTGVQSLHPCTSAATKGSYSRFIVVVHDLTYNASHVQTSSPQGCMVFSQGQRLCYVIGVD